MNWNRGSSKQATFLQFWWACTNCWLTFLLLADTSDPRCGLVLRMPICSAFKDALLQLFLSVRSSLNSALTSEVNKAFKSLNGYFLFFRPLCKILRPAYLAPTIIPCSKSLKFFTNSDAKQFWRWTGWNHMQMYLGMYMLQPCDWLIRYLRFEIFNKQVNEWVWVCNYYYPFFWVCLTSGSQSHGQDTGS